MRTRLGLTTAAAAETFETLPLEGPSPSAGPAACRFFEDMAAACGESCLAVGDRRCAEKRSRSRRRAGGPGSSRPLVACSARSATLAASVRGWDLLCGGQPLLEQVSRLLK